MLFIIAPALFGGGTALFIIAPEERRGVPALFGRALLGPRAAFFVFFLMQVFSRPAPGPMVLLSDIHRPARRRFE